MKSQWNTTSLVEAVWRISWIKFRADAPRIMFNPCYHGIYSKQYKTTDVLRSVVIEFHVWALYISLKIQNKQKLRRHDDVINEQNSHTKVLSTLVLRPDQHMNWSRRWGLLKLTFVFIKNDTIFLKNGFQYLQERTDSQAAPNKIRQQVRYQSVGLLPALS